MTDRPLKNHMGRKRLLALALAVCLLLSGMPTAAFAQAETPASTELREEVPPEASSSEASSSEASSSEASSSEASSSEATSGEAASGEAASGEATSGEATSSEATSSEATSSEATSSEATSSEATSGEATSSEATSSEATSSEATSSEASSSGTPACTCGALPDAEGNALHAEGCPLYEAPAPDEPPKAAAPAEELLAALPDPATLDGRAENAPAGEIAAAREALDALAAEARRAIDPALIKKLEALEHIRDTLYDCLDASCHWHYPPEIQAVMRENETPAPLTLQDLVEDYGVKPPMSHYLRSGGGTPQTLVVTEDNEDNAHTGNPDGDLDRLVNFQTSTSPVEVRFDLEDAPAKSAYLAVKAYDIYEEWGEKHLVYVNGEEIGKLVGDRNKWSTTVLEVPLELLRPGANYAEVQPCTILSAIFPKYPNYAVDLDWFQLVLDGGKEDASMVDFSISPDKPVPASEDTLQIPVHTKIQQNGSKEYLVEYNVVYSDLGRNLVTVFGRTAAAETVLLDIPNPTPLGDYIIRGILKDPDTEAIVATDEAGFYSTTDNGVIVGPKLTYTFTPDTPTNQDVTVALGTEPDERYPDVEFWLDGNKLGNNSASYIATEPWERIVTVRYPLNGEWVSFTKSIRASHIDKEPPHITYTPLTLPEETPDEQVKNALTASLSCRDGIWFGPFVTPVFTIPEGFTAVPGIKTVEVSATDRAGNTTVQSCDVVISPLPAGLSMTETKQLGADSFTLTGKLDHTGGRTYSETGFVWGAMPDPTLEVCHGQAAAGAPVNEKGGGFSVTAGEIVAGIPYFARAYARYDGGILYSDPIPFGLDAPVYGAFSVRGNGDNTFTISRAGGSDGVQTVFIRTVNGSAVGGTHFDHQARALTFTHGQTEQTVEVTEHGVNATYGGRESTGYSNEPRTYQLEIYRVKGGASIDPEGRFATRKMEGNQGVDRELFAPFVKEIQGTNHNHGDYDDDGLGWKQWYVNDSTARETMNITEVLTTPKYWRDLETAEVQYMMWFQACEGEDGYQHMQVTPGGALDLSFGPESGDWKGTSPPNASVARYACTIQHDIGDKNGNWIRYYVPSDSGRFFGGDANTQWVVDRTDGGPEGHKYVRLPLNEDYLSIGYSASGKKSDRWYTKDERHKFRVHDTQEPRILGVAPMAGGVYLPGDLITVAVIFDEIVDETNSALAAVNIDTNYGNMTYAGGKNTNVLYFTGEVPENVSGPVEITGWNGLSGIKDMCETNGTQTPSAGGSLDVTTDPRKPTVSIEVNETDGPLPRHRATVRAGEYQTLQYAWTQREILPISGWFDVSDGEELSIRQTDGDWYLYLLATSENGRTAVASRKFTFQSPVLDVAVSDPDAWKPKKTISITPSKTAGEFSISMEGPVTGSFTGNGSREVVQNGTYVFTLTDGYGSVLTKRLAVEKIDPVRPILSILESGNTGAVHHSLSFSAEAADEGGAGVASVQYQWTQSETTPTDGWQTATGENGRYQMTYNATEKTRTTKYLHVRVTDHAGNTTDASSQGYTVVAEPEPGAKLVLNVTGGDPAYWSKGPVALNWSVSGGAGDVIVYLPESGLSDQAGGLSDQASGTVNAGYNGLYTFQATDGNGGSATQSVLITKIDAERPVLGGLAVSPEGWSNQNKAVTLSGVSDNRSPLADGKGNVTGYGGSGVAKREWRLGGGGYTTFTGDSFPAAMNGVYTVRLTDAVGNQNEYTVEVGGIERAAPSVTVSAPASGWSVAAQALTVTYGDEAGGSGVKSAKYAVVEATGTAPAQGLSDLPASGASIEISQDGTHYLYYRVEDNAGNVTEGYSGAVKVDAGEPTLNVTGGTTGAASLTLDVESAFGPSGGGVTVQKDGGEARNVNGAGFDVGEKGVYTFTATSNAGKTASRTVTVHEITFDAAGGSRVGSQLVVSGGTAAKPRDPARAGYTFQTWRKGGADYVFGSEVAADTALTAVWTLDAPTVAVTATPEGAKGTYAGGSTVVTLTAAPGHEAEDIAYAYQWYKGGDPVDGATADTLALKTVAQSGGYTVKVTASDGTLTSAETGSALVAVSIAKATPVVGEAPAASAITYGQSLADSALTGGDTGVDGVFSWTDGSITPAVANSGETDYSVTFTPDDGDNYTTATTEVKLTLLKKTLTPVVDAVEGKTYDGKTTAAGTLALSGAVFDERPAASGTFAFTSARAGKDKHVDVNGIVLTGNWGNNYALKTVSLTDVETTAEISRKEIGLSWSGCEGLVYTGNPVSVTAGATGLEGADSCAVTVQGGTGTGAGSYTATATALDNPNYKLPAVVAREYAIAKAPVSFAVTGNIHTYDTFAKAAAVAQTAGETTRVAAEKFSVSYEREGAPVERPTDAGSYDVMVELGDENFKHAGVEDEARKVKAGVLTIDRAPVSFTVEDNSHTYNQAAKAAKVAQTKDELSVGGSFTVAYRPKDNPDAQAARTVADAGTYDILVTLTDDNFRHAGESDGATRVHKAGELAIAPKAITATWRNLVHVYDGRLKAPDLSLEDVVEGDECGYQVSGGGRAQAGVSPAAAELTGADAPNYRLLNPTASLTIQKAPVAFTVTGNAFEADGAPHTATVAAEPAGVSFTVTYWKDGERAPEPTEPGTYEIRAELESPNHRHSGETGGGARRIGVLTLYRQTPPPAYTAAFEGGEGAVGTAPILPASPAGAVLYLPVNGPDNFTQAGHAFIGWALDGRSYQPGDAFTMPARNVTFTAQWEQTVHNVGGLVNQEGIPVAGATVTLMQGADVINEVKTGPDGSYSFTSLTPGLYNLVARKSGTVMTIKVEIVSSDVTNANIELPKGRTNSVVVVEAGMPPIVVGNLEQTVDKVNGVVFTAKDAATVDAGGMVEIKFTAEEQPMGDAGDTAQIEAEKAGSDKVALLLELTLNKTVTPFGGEATVESLPESNVLLETVLFLPADLQGKYAYTVYRVHGGEVQALTMQENEAGEYIELDQGKKKLTLHAKFFSAYAVAYADEPRSSDGSGSGDSNGSFFRPGEYDFWGKVREKILNAEPGGTVKAKARGFDRMPEKVMAALRERDGVTLAVDWTGGEAFVIPAGRALEQKGPRVYYPLAYLEGIYNALPAAVIAEKTNPETGGVQEVTAPLPAATAAPATVPAVTPDDAGFVKIAVPERKAAGQAQKAAAPVDVPAAPEQPPAGNGVWLILLLAAAAGGAWVWKRKKPGAAP